MLILKSDISAVCREDLETDCELLWTEIIKDSSNIMLGVFYRPSGSGSSWTRPRCLMHTFAQYIPRKIFPTLLTWGILCRLHEALHLSLMLWSVRTQYLKFCVRLTPVRPAALMIFQVVFWRMEHHGLLNRCLSSTTCPCSQESYQETGEEPTLPQYLRRATSILPLIIAQLA